MKDCRGLEIEMGDLVAWVGRQEMKAFLNVGTVVSFDVDTTRHHVLVPHVIGVWVRPKSSSGPIPRKSNRLVQLTISRKIAVCSVEPARGGNVDIKKPRVVAGIAGAMHRLLGIPNDGSTPVIINPVKERSVSLLERAARAIEPPSTPKEYSGTSSKTREKSWRDTWRRAIPLELRSDRGKRATTQTVRFTDGTEYRFFDDGSVRDPNKRPAELRRGAGRRRFIAARRMWRRAEALKREAGRS